jgi:pimeloyl-ACP methyl ester carboxylesterase
MDPALWFRIIFYWIFTPGFFEDDVMVEGAVSLAVEYPFPQRPVAFRNQAEALARYTCRKDLKMMEVPTLVVCGEQDILIPGTESRELLVIPGSRLQIIPGAAHSIHLEQPQVFNALLLEFLEQN